MLETLKGRTLTNTAGFAAQLEAISERWVEGNWLTSLEVADNGTTLRLTGFALGATDTPLLVERLTRDGPLEGIGFRTFRVTRSETHPDRLRFVLDTRRITPEEQKALEKEEATDSTKNLIPISAGGA